MLISRWLHHYNLTSIRCNLTPILIASNEYRIIVVRVYRNKRMSLCSATLTYPQTCVAWRPSATCVSCQNCWRKWLDKDNSTRSKKKKQQPQLDLHYFVFRHPVSTTDHIWDPHTKVILLCCEWCTSAAVEWGGACREQRRPLATELTSHSRGRATARPQHNACCASNNIRQPDSSNALHTHKHTQSRPSIKQQITKRRHVLSSGHYITWWNNVLRTKNH